ncbi:MAG: hypothetical protein IJC04_12000 [Oscillospiraceae bacterium]|nr:hypothetical protein [Oscillospiraceae bacterium]
MAKMECPICGKSFDGEMVAFLENGNPACPHCVNEEQKRQEKTNEKE